tara:strand:+ start:111 stop:332 length:222 start_codon:yes stop_codon:yes gene_type:complete
MQEAEQKLLEVHMLLGQAKINEIDIDLKIALLKKTKEAIEVIRCCETSPCSYAEGYNDAISKIKEEAKYIDKQ